MAHEVKCARCGKIIPSSEAYLDIHLLLYLCESCDWEVTMERMTEREEWRAEMLTDGTVIIPNNQLQIQFQ